MGPDEAYKNKIGERLTGILVDALEVGEVDENEASEISSYILDNINNVKSNSELFDLMTTISKEWPIFSKAVVMEQNEISENKKDVVVGQVSDLIKADKIDDAIKVVENATTQNGGGI